MSERPRLEARQSHQRPHVLIICDDASLASFLNEGLPLGGFWTSVIASGLQAIEVFRLRQFDLILLDAGLTSFAAPELVRRLRGTSSRTSQGLVRTPAPIVLIAEPATALPHAELEKLDVVTQVVAPVELDDLVRDLHRIFAEWQESNPDVPLADFRNLRAE